MVHVASHSTPLPQTTLPFRDTTNMRNTTPTRRAGRPHRVLSHTFTFCISTVLTAALHADTLSVCQDGSCDFTDVQSAIDAANEQDVIEVSGETYLLSAPIKIFKNITLRGTIDDSTGELLTRLDGQDQTEVMWCIAVGPQTVLDRLVFQNGRSEVCGGLWTNASSPTVINCTFEDNAAVGAAKGTVRNQGGNPAFSNCRFINNSSEDYAGGMYNEGGASPTLVDCSFTNNSSETVGGGMFNALGSAPVLTNCTFTENSAENFGGGMHNSFAANPTLTDCTFTGNSAQEGGGMYNFAESTPTLTNCVFSGNTSEFDGAGMGNFESLPKLNQCTFSSNHAGNDGGGMYNTDDSSPQLIDCLFENNSAENQGGGIHSFDSGLVIAGCTFTDNSVSSSYATGGGMYIRNSQGTMTDCTFTGNSSQNTGGGMYIRFSGLVMDDCTFEANSAKDGGGIYNSSSNHTLTDCTFTGNSVQAYGGGMYNSGGSPNLTGCSFTDNGAEFGGGMFNNSSSPNISGCRFTNNSADAGGGLYAVASPSFLTTTLICDNSGGQIVGPIANGGGNCISHTCLDSDGDGIPDCNVPDDLDLQVPDEYSTISEAIDAAAEGAIITIAGGTYQPGSPLELFGKAITLRGSVDAEGTPTTILDGQGTHQLIRCSSREDSSTVFENLVIQNGHTDTNGGGMHLNRSSPTVINCVFRSNSAENGGGIYIYAASPTFDNCTFSLNVADYGGGILFSNSLQSPDPVLSHCSFSGNAAQYGGGLYNYECDPMLTECSLVDNSADYGGGIYSHYSSTPTLGDTIVCENAPNQVFGDFTDEGGNCINDVCDESCAYVTCPADIDGDAVVGASDLTELLSRWGCIVDPPGFACAQSDLNEDGTVDGADLTILLTNWGACQYRPPS